MTDRPPNDTNRPIDWTAGTVRPHVLIVSDDAGLATFLGEGLVLSGFWTSVVASGIQVLEVIRLRPFDLIVVDAALGGIGATETILRIRGRSGRSPGDEARTDIPLVVVAATADEIPPAATASGSADDALVAPFELPEIAARLFAIFAEWKAAHPGRPMSDEVVNVRPEGR